jgi:chorismate mutase/prephenate dehydratase
MELNKLRREVDKLDTNILKLLNKRTKLILEIGKLKQKKGISVYVPGREKEVYGKLLKKNQGPLPNNNVRAIYREIMSGALSLEKQIRIAYLGPQFTFTHLASLKKFGSSIRYVSCNSIADVFMEVEKERCDYGVVPIENSIEGAVNYTLDMFIDSGLKIFSEIYLEISHNVLGRGTIENIEKIYSNPQVFGQCRLWLKANLPHAELIEVSSTAKAAELAAQRRNTACIAATLAGKKHKLKILAASIEDSPRNVTRFLVIGKKLLSRPTGDDKTSIVFSVRDRVGVLHDMLIPFKKARINLTKIESRPSKVAPWQYYFFIDFEGHHETKHVKKSLNELKKHCTLFKILGSYPQGHKGE